MVIIIEGADLVGKTTLAEELSMKINVPQTGIWIDLNNPKPAVISVSKTLNQIIQAIKPDIIFDRSFISEWVYSKIKNREDEYLKDLINDWKQHDNLFLFNLFAKDEVLRQRYKSRGDKLFSLDEVLKANELYQKLYDYISNHITCILIDVSEMTTEEQVDHIINYLNLNKL
jgi:thymidylate kinase